MAVLGLLCGVEATAAPRLRVATTRSFVHQFAAMPGGEALRPADLAFLETAVDHSRHEMKIAELATAHAADVDIRATAGQIAADHRRLAEQLAILLRSKGAAAGGEVTDTGPDLYNELVRTSPADFDRRFLETVGRLHEALLNLFEQAAADARDNEVRALAASSLPLLRDHRNKLTALRQALD